MSGLFAALSIAFLVVEALLGMGLVLLVWMQIVHLPVADLLWLTVVILVAQTGRID